LGCGTLKGAVEFFKQNQNNIKVVFFDIFDTILLREVHPEYIKKLWAKKIKMMLGLKASPEQLYSIRTRIEAAICEENKNKEYDLEFKYEELLKRFFMELIETKKYGVNGISYEALAKISEEVELDVENCVQRVDEDFRVVASFLKEQNIPMYCLSDFYLPKRMVLDLFERKGVNHFFSNVFVSSEYLLTKRTGRLYDKVLSEMNIPSKDILMIGDNEHSDYRIPISKGGSAYLINRDITRAFYQNHMKEALNTTALERKLEEITQKFLDETKLPFGQIALSLYAFIECLYNKFSQENISNVFFLSREGEYLKKLFDLYQTIHKLQPIQSHYLLVSRKATFLPSLKKLSDEKFDTLFRQYRDISINEFLLSLNFTAEQIREISLDLAFDFKEKANNLPDTKIFAGLLGCKKFAIIYEQNRQEQYDNFVQYVNSFGVNLEKEGIHLIDVGWKGTIQDHISTIMKNVDVYGHYLGLLDTGAIHSNSYKEGILFSRIPKKSTFFAAYNENRALFEVVLGASHGSAARYVQDETKEVRVITEEESLEHELYETAIKPMQNQMTNLFITVAETMKYTHYNYNDLEKFYAKNHAKMLLFPTEQQLSFFESLYHFENFGLYEFSKFNGAEQIKVKNKLVKYARFLRHPRKVLANGFWGPLTLRNEGVELFSKPYGIYRYLRIFKEV
jgi:predicted HAD superfamily hydrolase